MDDPPAADSTTEEDGEGDGETDSLPKTEDSSSIVLVQTEDSLPDVTADTAALQLVEDQALSVQDEEYQVQVAMALSVNYDPEAAQIETAKQISLGSHPTLRNTTAEVVAYRYWSYNSLNYDDKIMDGFYDVYGVVSGLSSETMPALTDLQETPVLDSMTWEAVLVNRATDLDLVNIEQEAVSIALSCRVGTVGLQKSGLTQRMADLVAAHMGGAVVDSEHLLECWRMKSAELRSCLGNAVLPLGRLQVGLARHRALLFKVLADTVGIPCRLVKQSHHMCIYEGAVNIIKVDDGREYIVDLMGAPGTLIPSDVHELVSLGSSVNSRGSKTSSAESSKPHIGLEAKHAFTTDGKAQSSSTGGNEGLSGDFMAGTGFECPVSEKAVTFNAQSQEIEQVGRHQSEPIEFEELNYMPARAAVGRSGHPVSLRRSPSWTEGIGSPAVRDMKVKDVSQYMMDAAKENPNLAQKLHDVLLESGVRAPFDLFSEISPKQLQVQASEDKKTLEEKEEKKAGKGNSAQRKEKSSVAPAPAPSNSSSSDEAVKDRLRRLDSVEGLGYRRPLEASYLNTSPNVSPSPPVSSEGVSPQPSHPVLRGAAVISVVQDEVMKHVPVAAAAAATAAVVASSMVVAAAKSDLTQDPTLEVPVAAAATATAAVVVATTAVVGKRLEMCVALPDAVSAEGLEKVAIGDNNGRHEDGDTCVNKGLVESGTEVTVDGEGTGRDSYAEEERVSDKSSGSISTRPDPVLDDVAEWEIPWEDIIIGERIGLGSYGEVYRGDWHGTEVAVKKFLNQDISGDALEEFRSEVRLMRRMRHPNVVLFMGAVMRAPNLSIVTEFLPRGSLYQLIHRSNKQLEERRRMRMALDVARGMNYLHNSTPVIVHRDLKSPNLLVDKNWVVKVCDFGLSRMKHNTFLSSKSTAGTPEWMAPEVLRNEPSNEKSDVYSFGVILWELVTLQQPWGRMNPMQVVGAVGFQHRCLDIPEDTQPVVGDIIRQCWQSDPSARPSFADIIDTLKPLLAVSRP